MSYYFSSYSYSSSMSNGQNKRVSSKGYAKSSDGLEQYFIYDKENDKVLKDTKGQRENPKDNFNVLENKKKLTKTEKEVYDELVKSNPSINPKYILDFINSKEFKLLENRENSKNKTPNKPIENKPVSKENKKVNQKMTGGS